MKNKKIIWILVSILLIWIALKMYQNQKYSVDIQSKKLSEEISNNINYSHGHRNELVKVQVIRVIKLDNSNIVLAFGKYDGQYGRTRLLEGPNGKYQIKGSLWGNRLEPAEVESFKTNKGRYQVVTGNNETGEIDSIELRAFTMNEGNRVYSDYTTNLAVPKKDAYLIYKKLPSDSKLKNFMGDIEFVCKNKDGKIIYPVQ